MGVYWYPANVTKKQFIDPHAVGCGVKIGEWNHPESGVWHRIDELTRGGYWAPDDAVIAVSDAGGLMVLRGNGDHGLVVDGDLYDQLEGEYENVSTVPRTDTDVPEATLPEGSITDAVVLPFVLPNALAEAITLYQEKHGDLEAARDLKKLVDRPTCATCEHWDRDGVNYGRKTVEPKVLHACRGMKSAEQLGCDTDCWLGTPPEFGCRDWEPRS